MASGDHPDTSPKPSGKKAKKLSQKEQSERFKEAAREIEAAEGSGNFEKIIDILLAKKDRISQ